MRVAWLNRVKQPLGLVSSLKELPAEEAIPRIGWFMSDINRPTDESRKLGRELILQFPEWRRILSEKLSRLRRSRRRLIYSGPTGVG